MLCYGPATAAAAVVIQKHKQQQHHYILQYHIYPWCTQYHPKLTKESKTRFSVIFLYILWLLFGAVVLVLNQRFYSVLHVQVVFA